MATTAKKTARKPAAKKSAPKAKALVATKPAKTGAPKESKTAALLKMLSSKNGVTVNEAVETFGWLPHTTRAAISTLVKKQKLPGSITNEAVEGRGRVYRYAAA